MYVVPSYVFNWKYKKRFIFFLKTVNYYKFNAEAELTNAIKNLKAHHEKKSFKSFAIHDLKVISRF
jgi:hypothetical protein